MKLNKILSVFVLSTLLSTGALASSQDIKITIDGGLLQTDVAPQIINDRTLVPVRAIFEAIGGEVEWDNDTQTVTGTKANDTVTLQVGNKKARINGKETTLDVPATAIKGRTLVPIRFVAESLGSGVFWDSKNNTVVISDENNNEKYFTFDKEEGEITDYTYSSTEPIDLVIPKVIDGVAVKKLGIYAFAEKNLRSVVVQEGVTDIYSHAFTKNKLVSVKMPEGLDSIGQFAFYGNDLVSVVIPESVTNIGEYSFIDNKLKSVTFPKEIKFIGKGAFANNNLSKVTISAWVRTIGKNSVDDVSPEDSTFDDGTVIIFKDYD